MTDINNTTEGIGVPLVEAMHALNRAAHNCLPDEDREALNAMALAGRHIMQSIDHGISPPDDEDDGTTTGPLAYELRRQADAAFACIQTMAIEAERRYRDTVVFDENGVGWAGPR